MPQFEYINSEEYFDNIRKCKNIICFGAGAKLRQALVLLNNIDIRPTVICDNNPELWGKTTEFNGESFEIVSYEKVKTELEEYTILLTMSIHNATETYQQMCDKGEKNNIFQFCNPFKVDNLLLQSKNIDNDFNNYQIVYNKLADDISRKLFVLNLNYKITGDMLDLYKMTSGNTFFDEVVIGDQTDAVYVDVGAYTGDTILKFLEYCGGKYKQYMALKQIKEIMFLYVIL